MPDPEIVCCGMVVADVLVAGFEGMPPRGETGRVAAISMAAGGDALNQATALAKLGNSVSLWGVVGDDAQGAFIRQHCVAHNIGVEGLFVEKGRATGTGIALIDKTGERSFLAPQQGSHHVYAPEHIDLDLIGPGLKVLSVGSLFCSRALDRKALAPLLRKAKSVGATTLADMVMDQRGYGLDELSGAWPLLDYAAPSEIEGELLTGEKDPKAIASALRRRGVKNVLLKRGAKGVLLFTGDAVFECPAFAVPVADTTGAGDNFVGGFIHGLAHGLSPEKALSFGAAAAALSIQAVGAGAGLRDLKQVEDFLSGVGLGS